MVSQLGNWVMGVVQLAYVGWFGLLAKVVVAAGQARSVMLLVVLVLKRVLRLLVLLLSLALDAYGIRLVAVRDPAIVAVVGLHLVGLLWVSWC